MKKNWRLALMIAALGILFGCVSSVFAQDVMTGAYGEASTTDPEVVAAARFAIARQARKRSSRITLISIERAEVQVVAGLNYKLWLKVRTRGQTQNATAVVYKNLKRRYSLSSWDVESDPGDRDAAVSNSTIEQLVASLADAYTSKTLGKLDAGRPYVGTVRLVIEHSLAGDHDKDKFERRAFKTLARAETWLQSQEHDEVPSRVSKPLVGCKKGFCTFNFDGGIMHNQLYLKRVAYGVIKGRPYIKTIYLLDGD